MFRYWQDVVDKDNFCAKEVLEGGICHIEANRNNAYTLHGGMVGGVKSADVAGDAFRTAPSEVGWNDWRADYQANEVSMNYNVMLASTLAQVMALDISFWTTGCTGVPTTVWQCQRRNHNLKLLCTRLSTIPSRFQSVYGFVFQPVKLKII